MGFVGEYTVTKRQQHGRNESGPTLDHRLQAIRQKSRQLERKMKKARDPVVKQSLETEMKKVLELWQFEREAVTREKETRLREEFYEAHRSGNSFLSWKLARTYLACKGGGVNTSSTTCLSRHDWETHFSRLLQKAKSFDLSDVDVAWSTTPSSIHRSHQKKLLKRWSSSATSALQVEMDFW